MSIKGEATHGLNQRIADRIRELRSAGGLSLDALATKTAVSRSMISVIERGEGNPTASVLEKLASGLNVTLASLFDEPARATTARRSPVSRRHDQPVWRDPASGYVRRNVSPPAVPQPMRIVDVQFPAGERVTFDNGPRDARVYQQVWVLRGVIDITVGHERHRLSAGDCLAMQLDAPTSFRNPTRKPARYAVVIASEPVTRK